MKYSEIFLENLNTYGIKLSDGLLAVGPDDETLVFDSLAAADYYAYESLLEDFTIVPISLEDISERTLTDSETKRKESMVLKLKKHKQDFIDRYGDNAESVMYAIATKRAKMHENKWLEQKGEEQMENLDEGLFNKEKKFMVYGHHGLENGVRPYMTVDHVKAKNKEHAKEVAQKELSKKYKGYLFWKVHEEVEDEDEALVEEKGHRYTVVGHYGPVKGDEKYDAKHGERPYKVVSHAYADSPEHAHKIATKHGPKHFKNYVVHRIQEDVELDESIKSSSYYSLVNKESKKIIAKGNKAEMHKLRKQSGDKHFVAITSKGIGEVFEEFEPNDDLTEEKGHRYTVFGNYGSPVKGTGTQARIKHFVYGNSKEHAASLAQKHLSKKFKDYKVEKVQEGFDGDGEILMESLKDDLKASARKALLAAKKYRKNEKPENNDIWDTGDDAKLRNSHYWATMKNARSARRMAAVVKENFFKDINSELDESHQLNEGESYDDHYYVVGMVKNKHKTILSGPHNFTDEQLRTHLNSKGDSYFKKHPGLTRLRAMKGKDLVQRGFTKTWRTVKHLVDENVDLDQLVEAMNPGEAYKLHKEIFGSAKMKQDASYGIFNHSTHLFDSVDESKQFLSNVESKLKTKGFIQHESNKGWWTHDKGMHLQMTTADRGVDAQSYNNDYHARLVSGKLMNEGKVVKFKELKKGDTYSPLDPITKKPQWSDKDNSPIKHTLAQNPVPTHKGRWTGYTSSGHRPIHHGDDPVMLHEMIDIHPLLEGAMSEIHAEIPKAYKNPEVVHAESGKNGEKYAIVKSTLNGEERHHVLHFRPASGWNRIGVPHNKLAHAKQYIIADQNRGIKESIEIDEEKKGKSPEKEEFSFSKVREHLDNAVRSSMAGEPGNVHKHLNNAHALIKQHPKLGFLSSHIKQIHDDNYNGRAHAAERGLKFVTNAVNRANPDYLKEDDNQKKSIIEDWAKKLAAENRAKAKAAKAAAPKVSRPRTNKMPKPIDVSNKQLHKALENSVGGKFEHFESEPKHHVTKDGYAAVHLRVTHSYSKEDLGTDMEDTAETYNVTAMRKNGKYHIFHRP